MPQRVSTTTKTRSFRWAYMVDEDSLRRLDRLLNEEVLSEAEPSPTYEDAPREFTYQVYFSDGSNLRTYSLDEVVDLPNSRDRRITSIAVSEPFWLHDLRVHISFRQYSSIAAVEYEVAGEASKALHLADRLDQHLSAVRQWYTPLIRVNEFKVLSILMFLFALAYLAFFVYAMNTEGITTIPPAIATFSFLGPVAIMVIGAVFLWLRRKLFPVATFAIGQGVARNKNLNYWRNVLGIVVVLGLILNVVAGLLVALLD